MVCRKLGGFKDTKGRNAIPQSFTFSPLAIPSAAIFFYPPTSHSLFSNVPWYGLVFKPESVGGIDCDLARSEGSRIKISCIQIWIYTS
jgi:hypothetical protein